VQPGLSADLIQLAVIFDDETGGTADELFRDAWLGIKAWENEVNGNGGLGGRKVQVVAVDSLLFDHRSALEKVCAGEFFAIVGSHSLGDADGAELLGTEQCFIADFAGQVYGSRRAVSPVTVLSNPFLNDTRQAGPARWLLETYPEASQSVGMVNYDALTLDLQAEGERQREMLQAQGLDVALEVTADLEEDPSDRIVGRWADEEAQSLVWTADPRRLIELLDALEEKPEFVLCERFCYSQDFLLDGGETVEGVYTWIAHSPFGSPHARGEHVLYQGNLASISREAGWSEVGFQSWMAGRLFEASFNSLLEVEPEAPTREALIRVARSIDLYTANDVLSLTNPAGGEPTPCFVLMKVRNGQWEQVHPLLPRDKDCQPENLQQLVTSASFGVGVASSASSADDQTLVIEEPESDLENPEDLDE